MGGSVSLAVVRSISAVLGLCGLVVSRSGIVVSRCCVVDTQVVPADDVLIDGVVRLGVVPELVDVVPKLVDEPFRSTVVPPVSWSSVEVPSPIRFVVSTAAEDDVPRSVVSATETEQKMERAN